MTSRRAVQRSDFPGQGTIYDRAGLPIDATGWVWKLNHAVSLQRLDFRKLKISSPDLLSGVAQFLADRIACLSPDSVRNTFETLGYLSRSAHFQECQATGGDLGERLFADLRLLPGFAEWQLHYVRAWYRWCTKHRIKQFSAEVLDVFEGIRIGGNEKGRAVLTRDPLQGAFDEIEMIALTTKLRSAGLDVLTVSERTLVWLSIALGCNPLALCLLREGDFVPTKEVGAKRVYHMLRVPRVKKRHPFFRAEFHPKMLNAEIGSHVVELIAENAEIRRLKGWPEGCAFPLFRRSKPRSDLMGGSMREFSMHFEPKELTRTLTRAVEKLGVVSHRTGKLLHVNTRRFRRTFGTRAVEENASPAELAVLLDHTDLQSVGVYYETRSSIVERLDAAMAVKLGPLADAFLGHIVDSEDEAVNGRDPAKRIPWFRRHRDRGPERAGNLGTCGSGPCALFAPLSCYTCERFQPWKNGPHREILQWLCDERERKRREGLDAQMVGIHDATIMAIGKVVAACEGAAE
jgi:integrase